MLPSVFTILFTPMIIIILDYNVASKSSYALPINKNKLRTIQSQTSGSKAMELNWWIIETINYTI